MSQIITIELSQIAARYNAARADHVQKTGKKGNFVLDAADVALWHSILESGGLDPLREPLLVESVESVRRYDRAAGDDGWRDALPMSILPEAIELKHDYMTAIVTPQHLRIVLNDWKTASAGVQYDLVSGFQRFRMTLLAAAWRLAAGEDADFRTTATVAVVTHESMASRIGTAARENDGKRIGIHVLTARDEMTIGARLWATGEAQSEYRRAFARGGIGQKIYALWVLHDAFPECNVRDICETSSNYRAYTHTRLGELVEGKHPKAGVDAARVSAFLASPTGGQTADGAPAPVALDYQKVRAIFARNRGTWLLDAALQAMETGDADRLAALCHLERSGVNKATPTLAPVAVSVAEPVAVSPVAVSVAEPVAVSPVAVSPVAVSPVAEPVAEQTAEQGAEQQVAKAASKRSKK